MWRLLHLSHEHFMTLVVCLSPDTIAQHETKDIAPDK